MFSSQQDVSDAIYLELVNTMLPLSLLLVGLTMLILHRSLKVLVICGLPIVLSLAVTFGTTVILDITLTNSFRRLFRQVKTTSSDTRANSPSMHLG